MALGPMTKRQMMGSGSPRPIIGIEGARLSGMCQCKHIPFGMRFEKGDKHATACIMWALPGFGKAIE